MRLPRLISAGLGRLQPGHIAHGLFILAIIGLAILYALPEPPTAPRTAPEPIRPQTPATGPQEPATEPSASVPEPRKPDMGPQPPSPIQVVTPPPRKKPAVADEPEARAVEPEAAESKATVPVPPRCRPCCQPWRHFVFF